MSPKIAYPTAITEPHQDREPPGQSGHGATGDECDPEHDQRATGNIGERAEQSLRPVVHEDVVGSMEPVLTKVAAASGVTARRSE